MRGIVVRVGGYWPAVVLVLAVSLLLGASAVSLNQAPPSTIRTSPAADGGQRVEWVMPDTRDWDAGLRPGQVVRAVAPPAGTGAWAAYAILSGPRAGQTAVVERGWPEANDLLLFALGLEFLAAGLAVYLLAADRAAANRFLPMAGVIAAGLIVSPPTAVAHPWAQFLEEVFSKGAAPLCVLFFFTTPVERWRPLRRLLVWAYLPLMAVYFYIVWRDPLAYEPFKGIAIAYLTCGVGASLVALAWPSFSRLPGVPHQLRPVLLCLGFAVAVTLVGSLIPYVFAGRYLIPPELAVAAWGALPIGFVWAMLRHRLMGVNIGNYAVLRTVFETIDDPIFVVDENGRLVDASKSGLIFLGLKRAGKGKQSFVALSKEWGECGEALLRRVLAGAFIQDEEHAIQSGRDAGLQVSVTGRPIYDERGRASLALLVYRDITDRKRRERELAHLATHDSLTGLPNRRVLEEALKRAVARARRGKPSVLLFLDLDRFKAVNDTYGHLAGDKALISLVRLLEAHLRAEDLVARVGGDEFAVLLRDVDAAAGEVVVQRLNMAAAEHRLDLGDHSLALSLSVGAVEIDGLLGPEEVLAQADTAMYAFKQRNGGPGAAPSYHRSHPAAPPPPSATSGSAS